MSRSPARPTYLLMVEGDGDFPLDMLRYDRCWPWYEADSHAILHEGRRRIVLESCSESMPTGRRWESRGWRIVEVGHREAGAWERAVAWSAWFHEHRYAWIKESVEIFGAINRRHVEAKFGITPAQVAVDFAEVQRRWPNLMTYNPSAKRYERTPS